MSVKVAICQPKIVLGGRLRVIVAIADLLNDVGITPEVVTSKLEFSPKDIPLHYGKQVDITWRNIPMRRMRGVHEEFYIWRFNKRLEEVAADYDLLIHTGNSLMFLPEAQQAVSYVFFPRKYRMLSPLRSIHLPDKRVTPLTRFWFQRKIQAAVVRRYPCATPHHIISMTRFTEDAIHAVYPELGNLPIIYPPVTLPSVERIAPGKRDKAIVTMGRFARGKRQLEQIELASRLPDFTVHVVGFVDDAAYYRSCEKAARTRPNVVLHPNLPSANAQGLMLRSRFFLHTLIKEPFGLTAVNAIALGCIPLVHDSGGQRETVPASLLRYQHLQDVPETIDQLNRSQVDLLIGRLQRHVRDNFSDEQFRRRMSAELRPYLA